MSSWVLANMGILGCLNNTRFRLDRLFFLQEKFLNGLTRSQSTSSSSKFAIIALTYYNLLRYLLHFLQSKPMCSEDVWIAYQHLFGEKEATAFSALTDHMTTRSLPISSIDDVAIATRLDTTRLMYWVNSVHCISSFRCHVAPTDLVS
ncbi:hypothetical protein TNIN_395291 [Trichonephila inaurata madagascariensis]|uniref:Uncharacterized protein n=1 Tax=Trichonephila inaurata madagascariensis TaxID=2747483 RepID=A0A8X6YQA6_9ARAC|nr:hypothetical protein TNIN_395291 [Trichonephila inaurata madagascariensis]